MIIQAWIVSSISYGLCSGKFGMADLRPLTNASVEKVFHAGMSLLMSSRKMLNNEQDFPEVLLLDVWRLCSIQRKMRVDCAVLGTVGFLSKMLVDYNLSDTDNGKLLLERVVQLFLSIDYGSRVSAVLRRDHDDSQLIPPFTGDERQL